MQRILLDLFKNIFKVSLISPWFFDEENKPISVHFLKKKKGANNFESILIKKNRGGIILKHFGMSVILIEMLLC